MIWYQGEANTLHPARYACEFPTMIEDYRARLPTLSSFGFVQIAPYTNYSNVLSADLRQAQLEPVFRQLDKVVFATTLDLVYPYSAISDIHPTFKQPVGARLAAQLLATEYGFPATPALVQPLYAKAAQASSGEVLSVDVLLSGCEAFAGAPCVRLIDPAVPPGLQPSVLGGWAIQTNDGAWWPAQAKATPTGLLLSTTAPAAAGQPGFNAVATSYARAAYPLVAAVTPAGLPLPGWCFGLDGTPCFSNDPAA